MIFWVDEFMICGVVYIFNEDDKIKLLSVIPMKMGDPRKCSESHRRDESWIYFFLLVISTLRRDPLYKIFSLKLNSTRFLNTLRWPRNNTKIQISLLPNLHEQHKYALLVLIIPK